MWTLVVNRGSSSLRLSVMQDGERVVSRTVEDWSGTPTRGPLQDFLAFSGPVDAVGVLVVHGGDRCGPRLLDEDELSSLEDVLAPLHQPKSLVLARMVSEVAWLPGVRLFRHVLPRRPAATYPAPREWRSGSGCADSGSTGCRAPTRSSVLNSC